MNPYLDLLYRSLASAGIPTGPQGKLSLRWLFAHRRSVRYLHAHWQEQLYRAERGPAPLRPLLSWVKVALLEFQLSVARLLGYRLVWTIHQVFPHRTSPRLDLAGARVLVRHAELLMAHDAETASRARGELGRAADHVAVVPHGSYVGVYPAGRPRAEVRGALGIDQESVVFLCFGELRANSDIGTLLDAFSKHADAGSALIVAGHAKDATVRAALTRATSQDPRIVRIEGFVRFDSVRELYEAADVAVVPRKDGGTSGSLILALSLGRPVLAADLPAYRRLLADGAAGWLFRPGDTDDVAIALRAATRDNEERALRTAAARNVAAQLDWAYAGARIAALLPE